MASFDITVKMVVLTWGNLLGRERMKDGMIKGGDA
jgi:hypothetical protein